MSHKFTSWAPVLASVRPPFALLFSVLILVLAVNGSAHPSVEEPAVFSKCWDYKTFPNLSVRMAADSSHVYFLDAENRLHGVDLVAGKKVWSSELGGDVVSNLLAVGDSVMVVTSMQSDATKPDGKALLRAVSRQTGITTWRGEISGSPIIWLGVVGPNIVAVGSTGSIASFTSADGKSVWSTSLGSSVTSEPDFTEGGIELGTTKNEIMQISAQSGGVRVVWKPDHLPTAVYSDSDGRLVIGDERGNVTLISRDGDRVWTFKNGAQISSISPYSSEYLAASYDNFVYKLSRYGDVKWKRRLSGRVADRPLLLGEAAVVSITGAGSMYVLDLKNGKILNRIELGDEVSLRTVGTANDKSFIAAGPGGLSYYSSEKCPAK